MLSKTKKGTIGENLAVDYLEKKGYRILQRNYRFEHGEIDIIAEDGNVLVFVEVKARRSKEFGEPEDAVTPRKREKIRATANGYLFENNIDDKECRFDVIAIDYQDTKTEIRHITDAF
ncbi:MAG: YraN family protein [Ignavibacteriales bacterium]|nr:YraN family protein [Ignavibacteriales bacterium]